MKLKPLLKQQLSRARQMANKNIMVGILLAGKALLKSPYVKRYMPSKMMINLVAFFILFFSQTSVNASSSAPESVLELKKACESAIAEGREYLNSSNEECGVLLGYYFVLLYPPSPEFKENGNKLCEDYDLFDVAVKYVAYAGKHEHLSEMSISEFLENFYKGEVVC
jgi:hypothetical protein